MICKQISAVLVSLEFLKKLWLWYCASSSHESFGFEVLANLFLYLVRAGSYYLSIACRSFFLRAEAH